MASKSNKSPALQSKLLNKPETGYFDAGLEEEGAGCKT